MRLSNTSLNQQEQNLFQEFSENLLLFDGQKQQIQQCSEIPIHSLGKRDSFIFQQKTKKTKLKRQKNLDDFIESVLFKQKQVKDDLIVNLKRFPSNQDSLNSQNNLSDPIKCEKRSINKTEMNRIYTKNYRLKKKQQFQSLKEENRFLKQKIDDLSFRLRQAELEINKLKHEDLSFTANFNTIKDQCLKEIQNILSMEGAPFKQVYDLEQKFKNLVAFSNKPRLDLLNYLMSELLQNLVSDQGMYFIQCVQNKSGIYRQSQTTPLKKLDIEVLEILNGTYTDDYYSQNCFRQIFSGSQKIIMAELAKIKILWKKLYEDYINIINQGLKLETLYRPLFEKRKSYNQDWVLNSLKLRLHFQKNKYRKDIRQIRQTWFKEIQQGKNNNIDIQTCIQKKCKLQN